MVSKRRCTALLTILHKMLAHPHFFILLRLVVNERVSWSNIIPVDSFFLVNGSRLIHSFLFFSTATLVPL